MPSRYVKNDFVYLETAHDDAKQIGNTKRVNSRKIIESPSAPRVNVRLLSAIVLTRNKN